jgi:hypothetical protein
MYSVGRPVARDFFTSGLRYYPGILLVEAEENPRKAFFITVSVPAVIGTDELSNVVQKRRCLTFTVFIPLCFSL